MNLAYDPALRLYQVAGAATTRFAYDGVNAIAEYDGANALQRRFVFGPGIDEPIVQYEGTGTTDRRFLSADERGSIISLTDSSGTLLTINRVACPERRRRRRRRDEYGKPQGTNAGRFQYTGQKWIGEAGLYDYKARFYAPHLGIFAQTDPIGYGPSPNLYAYVLNDPVNLIDPLGLQDQGAIIITGKRLFSVPKFNWDIQEIFRPEPERRNRRDRPDRDQNKNRLPCSAANQSGKGVLIKLGYTNIPGPQVGFHHTFVMAIDPITDSIYASRAGPGRGLFVATSGRYQPGFPDYGGLTGIQTVGWINAPFGAVTGYMNAFAATTNANLIIYGLVAQNSNSYTAALLAGMGLNPPTPEQLAPGLTGIGSNPPSPEMACAK